MQLGMIGLGRMGSNMVKRLLRAGHACVVHASSPGSYPELERAGARPAKTLPEFVQALERPRTVWLMIPAGAVESVLDKLVPLLESGDVIVDGGNSYYRDDIRRAAGLAKHGIHYIDCGTSGGVWGLERGYCLMIGGDKESVQRLDPIFASLAPGRGAIPSTAGRESRAGTAELGYLHCGPAGAGHFVKMVHNGIEYGLMAAYAEGFNILKHANVGADRQVHDAETAPLREPEAFRYDLDLADIAEVWRRGSVIASWLLDLTSVALAKSPQLAEYSGRVSDSGEGRWTIQAAVEAGVPAHVLAAALFERFDSRAESEFQNQVISAMRFAFGGHLEKKQGG